MEMTEQDRVFDAFRNCITEPKCKDCPWTECDKLKNRRVEIPIDLALAVMRMLKAQEPQLVISSRDYIEGTVLRCPKCKDVVHKYNGNYCPHCGQELKWE